MPRVPMRYQFLGGRPARYEVRALYARDESLRALMANAMQFALEALTAGER
jgi:hypothetical protein